MNVAILVPMLHRAHRVAPLLESIGATAPGARVVFVCSPGDDVVLAAVADHEHVIVDGPFPGDYARKINAGYRHTTEPLLLTAADDLLFHQGWLEAAEAQLVDGVGVVGTNDMGHKRVMRGEHSTHSVVTRDYVDRFGTIDERGVVLHEGYPHEFVDDEFVQTAMARNAWAFAADSRVEHLHPSWGKAPTDELYDQQAARMRQGRKVFERRRRLWM